MSSRREAEKVVNKIRKSRRANDPGGAAADANARSLSRALDMLSTQLYTKSTHFILELIQNADDNTYAPGVDPSLTLVYREDGYLWVGCNETGFTKANVEAICDINDSTKKVTNATTKGYIGEKGIGFKSVFKVADVVWVSSGNYTFRFDRDSVLGMIVPIWCDFNSTKLVSERTLFCLRIPSIRDRATVKADLLSLRTELLLFLRKLRKIDVRIYGAGEDKPSSGFVLTRRQPPESQPQAIITLDRKDSIRDNTEQSEELFMVREAVDDMPAETKREGIRSTEIVMAFPTSIDQRSSSPRPVYNFLPISTYGFTVRSRTEPYTPSIADWTQFLLQADFILTANRENIERDNAWNDALLEGAIGLFTSAVRQFNRTGICKYSWPAFAACKDAAHGTIFQGFMTKLRSTLQDESVLESQAGYLSRPSELMIVPEHFADGHEPRRPLFDDPLNTYKYASFAYASRDLEAMGVVYQTPHQIAAILKWMSPQQLQDKSSVWHSRLAIGITNSDPLVFETTKLIPLRDGDWCAPISGPFYLPPQDDKVDIPNGIEVRIIGKDAAADPARKHLFTLLGAKPLTSAQICNHILDRHRFLSISNSNLPASCLVSHAWYLFTYGSISLNYGALKLANELGQAVSGDELYMQLPNSVFLMKDYLPRSWFAADFVHSDYLTQGGPSDRRRWHSWLTDTLHVSVLPNLLGGHNGAITREFQYLIDNHPSRVWLGLIKDNWAYYAMDPALLSNRISSILVKCTDQTSCRLDDAYLGTPAIMQEPSTQQYVHLIDVPDPGHADWLKLARLGLRTKPDLEFYLTILRGIATSSMAKVNRHTVLRLYKNIEKLAPGDAEQARAAFKNEHLVLQSSCDVASPWLCLADCRWQAPDSLTNVESLSRSFPELRELFVKTLEVRDADAADVLEEIFRLHTSTPSDVDELRATTKALIMTLGTFPLADARLDKHFTRMASMKILQLRKAGAQRHGAFTDTNWFIADRLRYAKCFEGMLWFLDFDKQALDSLKRVFDRMHLTGRRISRHVMEDIIADGEYSLLPQATKELQAKAHWIALLAPDPTSQARVSTLIYNTRVCSLKSLLLRRSVIVDGRKVHGANDKGRIVLDRTDGHTACICVASDSISGGKLPWHFICDSLMSFLGIPESRQMVFNSILYTQDHALIEDMLERAGLLENETAARERNGMFNDGSIDADPTTRPVSDSNRTGFAGSFRQGRHSST